MGVEWRTVRCAAAQKAAEALDLVIGKAVDLYGASTSGHVDRIFEEEDYRLLLNASKFNSNQVNESRREELSQRRKAGEPGVEVC
jgi:hypothetical protein